MQVSGRLLIVVALGVALAMSAAAWWYQYQYSRRAAQFWGGPAAKLLVGASEVEFLELAPVGAAPSEKEQLAEREVVVRHDISRSPGLIHLRHVFAQDSNFIWDQRREEPIAAERWAYALRFTDGAGALVILLREDLEEIGKLAADGRRADTLPCPRVAGPVREYLRDIGVFPLEPTSR